MSAAQVTTEQAGQQTLSAPWTAHQVWLSSTGSWRISSIKLQRTEKEEKVPGILMCPNNSMCLSEEMSAECKKYTMWILTLPVQKIAVRNGADHMLERQHKLSWAVVSRSVLLCQYRTLGHRSAMFYMRAVATSLFIDDTIIFIKIANSFPQNNTQIISY